MNQGALLLQTGAVFCARYEIVRCIQAGGMGAVYEVVDLKTRRRRAMKVMLPSVVADPDLRARFKQEATGVLAADIDSEHIVETFDADVDAATGAPFIVMELLRGGDLGAALTQRGKLPFAEVVNLLYQAAMALDRTHAAGVVHRDLKPENLFLARRGVDPARLKVLDFGIAKVVQSSSNAKASRTIGTPLYMAPEQIRGDGGIGPRADLYALGHIAYALVAGEAYWQPDAEATPATFQLLSRIMLGSREAPTLRAAARRGVMLPTSFDVWFSQAVAVYPADRFDSASAMVHALAPALGVALPTGSGPIQAVQGRTGATSRTFSSTPPSADSKPPRAITPAADPTKVSGPQGTEVLGSSIAPPPKNKTTAPVSSDPGPSHPNTAAGVPRKGVLAWWLAGAACLCVCVGAVALKGLSDQAPNPVSTGAVATAVLQDAAAAPAVSESVPATSAISVLPAPADPAPTTASPSAEPAPSAAPAAHHTVHRAPAHADWDAITPPPMKTAPPKANCAPPFTVDANGVHHAKPECL